MTNELIFFFLFLALGLLLGWKHSKLRENGGGSEGEEADGLLMTEKDIIQALKCCASADCTECPLQKVGTADDCTTALSIVCLDLIKHQKDILEATIAEQETKQETN